MSFIYRGTTPHYWLDYQSLDNWMMYLAYGKECQVEEAQILLGVIAEAFSKKKIEPPPKLIETVGGDKPDLKKLYRIYGSQIKRGGS